VAAGLQGLSLRAFRVRFPRGALDAVGRAARPSLVALLYLLLSSPLPASVTLADDYIQKSGLAEQLGLIAGRGLLEIEQAQAEPQAQTPRLTDDQMERLRSAVKVAFAAERLRLAIRSHLEALLPEGDAELFLKWLDTPFGKRVTAIEVAASAQEAPKRETESAPQTLAGLSTTRKAELERILKASGIEDRTATMALNMAWVMARAAGMQVPELPPAYGAQDRLENPRQDRLEPSRRQIAIELAPTALAYIAAVYAKLSDDELRDYATVLERSSMRRVIEATNVAFDRALTAAAIEVDRRVGESTRPAATRIDGKPIRTRSSPGASWLSRGRRCRDCPLSGPEEGGKQRGHRAAGMLQIRYTPGGSRVPGLAALPCLPNSMICW
jgi:hypothetical protein